jgi:aspartyl-tRNA(Asn)/glutamyl-tRNA(Gln) amidotransferase subunit C
MKSRINIYCFFVILISLMKITQDQVRHISKLARLSLTDDEVERFAGQLSAAFDYMEVLNEVDTEGVLPTCQVTGLKDVHRADEVSQFCDPQELLKCSELPVERDQIKVKSVM